MSLPVFITGNQYKADYLAKLLDMPLDHQKVELDEIQSASLEEIVIRKAKQAYEQIGRPVLVEDVALGFNALHGLPGPFVKFFVESENGLENMCRMLDGFNDRTAKAECMFAYYDGKNCTVIAGSLVGSIADTPRGEGGFGWDRIFCPEGYEGKTRAELILEQNEATYKTIKPIAKLRSFLESVA